MNLVFVSSPLKNKITALASSKDFTFAAAGGQVHVFKRAKFISALPLRQNYQTSEFEIIQLLVLGDVLLGVCTDNCIRIWDHVNNGNQT
jgi:WD40 repeat protein